MKSKTILKLAFTNLLRRKLRSFLTIIAVSVAIGVLFFLLNTAESIKNQITRTIYQLSDATVINFNEKIDYQAISASATGQAATPSAKTKKITDETIKKVSKFEHVRKAYPQIYVSSYENEIILKNQVIATSSAVMLNPVLMEEKTQFEKRYRQKNGLIKEGKFFTSNEEESLVVPEKLAKTLKLKINDQVEIKIYQTPYQADFTKPPADKKLVATVSSKVIGISNELPILPFEYRDIPLVLTSFKLNKKINDLIPIDQNIPIANRPVKGQYFSGIVFADSITNIRAIQSQIISEGYDATTIFDGIDAINQFFLVIQLILLGFSMVGLLISLIGISNTMYMSTLERTKEIGILKALGSKDRDIYRIFLFEAGAFGFIGGLVGIAFATVLGYLGAFIANIYMQSKVQEILGSGVGIGFEELKITYSIDPKIFFAVLGFSVLLAIIAGFLPARKASKLNPIQALKYE